MVREGRGGGHQTLDQSWRAILSGSSDGWWQRWPVVRVQRQEGDNHLGLPGDKGFPGPWTFSFTWDSPGPAGPVGPPNQAGGPGDRRQHNPLLRGGISPQQLSVASWKGTGRPYVARSCGIYYFFQEKLEICLNKQTKLSGFKCG